MKKIVKLLYIALCIAGTASSWAMDNEDPYIQDLIHKGCSQESAEAIGLFADSQGAFLKPLNKDASGIFTDLIEFTGRLRAANISLVPSSATAEDATKLMSLMQIVMLVLEDRSNISNYASELVAGNALLGKKYDKARSFFNDASSAQTTFIPAIAVGIESEYNAITSASSECLVDLSGLSLEEKALFRMMMAELYSSNLSADQKVALRNIETWRTMIQQFVLLMLEKTEV